MKTVPSFKEYLSIGAAAKLLGVSINTLRRWDKLGFMKAHRRSIGSNRMYKLSDINQVLKKMERN